MPRGAASRIAVRGAGGTDGPTDVVAAVADGGLGAGSSVRSGADEHPDTMSSATAVAIVLVRPILRRYPGGVPDDAVAAPVGKCDKTRASGLTTSATSSYRAPALIGGNRGRGAGKGR